jgi:transposase-like protein
MEDSVAFEGATQGELSWDIGQLFRGAIRLVLECVLQEEVRELVGARRYERLSSRKDHLNGTYLRRLLTSMGLVELTVPRTRASGSPTSSVIGRYKRRSDEIDRMVTTAYVEGVSTRDMKRVTRSLMGAGISRSTVSRVTKALSAQVEELRRAPITEPVPYLYLDATFLDARWARSVENVSALVAYGVGSDGHRRLLGLTIGAEESEDSWSELLLQLAERGLSGVELVIADEHRGLASAVRRHLPEARRQRCTVHLERNVLTKAPQRLRGRVAKQLRGIFQAASAGEAKKRLQAFAGGLGQQVPEALRCLEEGFTAATQYFAFPKPHWIRIRSTNGLERLHGEIKRRIRSVGAFPDRDSALRLVTAVALETTRVWADRKYLDMSSLVTIELPGQAVA